MQLDSRITLNNGVEMPRLGLGVWQMRGRSAVKSMRHALDVGYRLIDTATMYRNEAEVGEAVRASGIPRDEVFVTTKVWGDDQGYERTLRAFEASRRRLGMDVVDLYLIHWPEPGKREGTWRAMAKVLEDGTARAVGVSNYMVQHLEGMDPPVPAVNQIELHPFLQPREAIEECRRLGIAVEAYSPLARATRLRDRTLRDVAARHGKTAAQVMLRWGLQHDYVVIPKSSRPKRIEENADIFDFEIASDDMAALDALDERLHVTWDPTDEP